MYINAWTIYFLRITEKTDKKRYWIRRKICKSSERQSWNCYLSLKEKPNKNCVLRQCECNSAYIRKTMFISHNWELECIVYRLKKQKLKNPFVLCRSSICVCMSHKCIEFWLPYVKTTFVVCLFITLNMQIHLFPKTAMCASMLYNSARIHKHT